MGIGVCYNVITKNKEKEWITVKKALCLLLVFVILLGIFAGCEKKPDADLDPTEDSTTVPTTMPPASDNTTQPSHSFQISSPDSAGTRVLTITDNRTNNELQTIRLEGHEWFTEEPMYLMDISFDGNRDIVFPYVRSASGLYYKGYVWNNAEGQYVYAPTFESVSNFALYKGKKAVLSYRSADKITTHSMFIYDAEKQDFTIDRSLYWEPAEEEGYLRVTELQYIDGVAQQVCTFITATTDGYLSMDLTDPNIVPYYMEASLWALDTGMWEHVLAGASATVKDPTTADKDKETVEIPEPSAPEKPTDTEFSLITSVDDYFVTKGYTPPNKVGLIQYLFHEPIRNTGKDYPLIIFLHGLGDTVNESTLGTSGPLIQNLIMLENQSEAFSTYTLVPSTPLASEGWWVSWQLDFLKQLIYDLVDNYNIDPKRIYITGISMGGYTTCDLVNQMPPDTFAAAVPLSGSRYMLDPTSLYNTAFRIYHSKNDTVVDVSCSQGLYYQLTVSEHPNVEYIQFDDGNHISPLYSVYYDKSFYDWLFAQRLP